MAEFFFTVATIAAFGIFICGYCLGYFHGIKDRQPRILRIAEPEIDNEISPARQRGRAYLSEASKIADRL